MSWLSDIARLLVNPIAKVLKIKIKPGREVSTISEDKAKAEPK